MSAESQPTPASIQCDFPSNFLNLVHKTIAHSSGHMFFFRKRLQTDRTCDETYMNNSYWDFIYAAFAVYFHIASHNFIPIFIHYRSNGMPEKGSYRNQFAAHKHTQQTTEFICTKRNVISIKIQLIKVIEDPK